MGTLRIGVQVLFTGHDDKTCSRRYDKQSVENRDLVRFVYGRRTCFGNVLLGRWFVTTLVPSRLPYSVGVFVTVRTIIFRSNVGRCPTGPNRLSANMVGNNRRVFRISTRRHDTGRSQRHHRPRIAADNIIHNVRQLNSDDFRICLKTKRKIVELIMRISKLVQTVFP